MSHMTTGGQELRVQKGYGGELIHSWISGQHGRGSPLKNATTWILYMHMVIRQDTAYHGSIGLVSIIFDISIK